MVLLLFLTPGLLTPVFLTPVLLTLVLLLPSKQSPRPLFFSSAPYSQWPLFKKMEDAPSVTGDAKVFS